MVGVAIIRPSFHPTPTPPHRHMHTHTHIPPPQTHAHASARLIDFALAFRRMYCEKIDNDACMRVCIVGVMVNRLMMLCACVCVL